MIHEIAPHRYDNAFLQSAPGEGDAALYYEKDTILLCQEGKGWRIPQFSDLTLEAAEGAERLFSIDGQGFYLLSRLPQALPGRELTLQKVRLLRELAPWVGFAGVTGWQLGRWEGQHRYCGAYAGKPAGTRAGLHQVRVSRIPAHQSSGHRGRAGWRRPAYDP